MTSLVNIANDMTGTAFFVDAFEVSVGVYRPYVAKTIQSHDDASLHNHNNRLGRNSLTVLTVMASPSGIARRAGRRFEAALEKASPVSKCREQNRAPNR